MKQKFDVATPARESSTSCPATVPGPAVPSCCAAAPAQHGGLPSWVNKRRVLAVAGIALGGAGLVLGWDWLTAIGIAPLLVATAPCLIMCTLGLCMVGNKSASEQSSARAADPGADAATGSNA